MEKERKKQEKERDRGRERPQTLVLLRKRLLRSQSVVCGEVEAGAVRRLQVKRPQNTCPAVRLFGPCFKSGRTRRVFEMAASGAHARQASVNEPSGPRLFSGFWVESWHWRARSWRATQAGTRWISRSFTKALVRRLVCDGACPVSCAHSFAAVSADGTGLEHHDATV